MSHAPLHTLQTALRAEGFAVESFPPGPDFPLPSLQVALDAAEEVPGESQFALRLYLSPGAEGLSALYLHMLLPIAPPPELPPLRRLEWFTLLAGCNEWLPLGAFNLNAEDEISFSYVLRALKLEPAVVAQTLEEIAEWVHTVMPALEALRNSSHSAEELLERLEAELEQLS